MTILVCGSRDYNGFDYMVEFIDDYIAAKNLDADEEIVIINGDARGTDTLATSYAMQRGFSLNVFPAAWARYGKAAGPKRNHQMLREGKPDVVIAFPLKGSSGTRHMMEIATKAGVEVIDALAT